MWIALSLYPVLLRVCAGLIKGPSLETEVTSTLTRPVENVIITTKGLQDRNNLLLDGRTVEINSN